MLRRLLGFAVLGACGGTTSDIAWHELAGAPDAVESVAFDSSGRLVVFGGVSNPPAGTLHDVRRLRADAQWDEAMTATGQPFFSGLVAGHDGKLYAALSQNATGTSITVDRLEDEAAFTWTDVGIAVPTGDSVLGIEASGRMVATTTTNAQYQTWTPGAASWTTVPITPPPGDSAGFILAPNDDLVIVTPMTIATAHDGVSTTRVDCHMPELGDCVEGAGTVVDIASNGDIYFVLIGTPMTPIHAYFVMSASGTLTKLADLTIDIGQLRDLFHVGGHSYLVGFHADLEVRSLYRLDGMTWTKLGDLHDVGGSIRIVDDHTMYAFSNDGTTPGIIEGTF